MIRTILALLLAFYPSLSLRQYVSPMKNKGIPAATWTLTQHPHNFTCSGTSSGNVACTVTATSTGAGHLLILLSSAYEGQNAGNNTAPSYVSASGDSTWTHCPSSYANIQYSTNNFEATDCAYVLSSAGGATSFTFTWSYPTGTQFSNIDVEFLEVVRSTGSATYDTGNNTTSSCATSCAGPTLTLTGSSDYIAQWTGADATINSVSGAYTNPADIDTSNVVGGFAGALNQSSGTGPTWSVTSGGGSALSGLAFK
jgi:hypothetical protein